MSVTLKFLFSLFIPLMGTMILLETIDNNEVSPVVSARKNFEQTLQSGEEFYYFFPIVFNQYQPPTWEYVALDGNVTDIQFDPANPDHAFASQYLGGLFETHDHGISWTRNEDVSVRINDIEYHPITSTTMYLATWSYYAVYWSQDNGTSWAPIPGWPYIYPTLYSVAAHPISPTVLFAGSGNWEPNGGHIFKTFDGGETWYSVSPTYTNALTFAFDPEMPNIIYAGTQLRGVRKSIDGGETWYAANNGLPTATTGGEDYRAVIVHPQDSQQIFATSDAGIYVSYDRAETWLPLWEGIDANALMFHPSITGTLYMGASNGIYVSHNDGISWSRLAPCGNTVQVNRLIFDPNDFTVLWAATSNGLWRCNTHME
ncbi:MAG: hypothetical protein KF770_17015 [Anaerolineae bacterium]|nr:hypothetical protein [Anaerolineae bacterium]